MHAHIGYGRSMSATPDLAAVAALVADPTRARMLIALMDGRALTATELALEGDVAPSTASNHLTRLTALGLVSMMKQGRHRYFRIARHEVATALESLMTIAPRSGTANRPARQRDAHLRRARVCYDHLAGEAGVRLLERLREAGFIVGHDESLTLTSAGEAWCRKLDLDLEALAAKRRPLCRACLDWSERRSHLAGSLGARILDYLLLKRYARRTAGSRAVSLSAPGESFIEHPHLVT